MTCFQIKILRVLGINGLFFPFRNKKSALITPFSPGFKTRRLEKKLNAPVEKIEERNEHHKHNINNSLRHLCISNNLLIFWVLIVNENAENIPKDNYCGKKK
jgi:hypothetical protein